MSKKVLIVESRYYEDISNLLLEATIEQLNVYNVKFEKMEVLGCFRNSNTNQKGYYFR